MGGRGRREGKTSSRGDLVALVWHNRRGGESVMGGRKYWEWREGKAIMKKNIFREQIPMFLYCSGCTYSYPIFFINCLVSLHYNQ